MPSESFEALSLDNNVNYSQSPPSVLSPTSYSRSKSNLDQMYINKFAKPEPKPQNYQRVDLHRQSSYKEVPEKIPNNNNIRHSISDMNISKSVGSSKVPSRKNSFSKPHRNSSVPNVTKIPNLQVGKNIEKPVNTMKTVAVNTGRHIDIYVSPKMSPTEDEVIPVCAEKPVGLDMDDFLPVSTFLIITLNKLFNIATTNI